MKTTILRVNLFYPLDVIVLRLCVQCVCEQGVWCVCTRRVCLCTKEIVCVGKGCVFVCQGGRVCGQGVWCVCARRVCLCTKDIVCVWAKGVVCLSGGAATEIYSGIF